MPVIQVAHVVGAEFANDQVSLALPTTYDTPAGWNCLPSASIIPAQAGPGHLIVTDLTEMDSLLCERGGSEPARAHRRV